MKSPTVNPLYVDGPLAGNDNPIQREQLFRPYPWRARPIDPLEPEDISAPDHVVYYFHPFTLLGKVIFIGSLQSNFHAIYHEVFAQLFEVMVSDRAKAAM